MAQRETSQRDLPYFRARISRVIARKPKRRRRSRRTSQRGREGSATLFHVSAAATLNCMKRFEQSHCGIKTSPFFLPSLSETPVDFWGSVGSANERLIGKIWHGQWSACSAGKSVRFSHLVETNGPFSFIVTRLIKYRKKTDLC